MLPAAPVIPAPILTPAEQRRLARDETMRIRFPEYRMRSSPLIYIPEDTTSANLIKEINPILESVITYKVTSDTAFKMAEWRFVDPITPSVIGGSTPRIMLQHLQLAIKSLPTAGLTGMRRSTPLASVKAFPWMVAGLYGIHNANAWTVEDWHNVILDTTSLIRSNTARCLKLPLMPKPLIAMVEVNRANPIFTIMNAWAFMQWRNIWDVVEQTTLEQYLPGGLRPLNVQPNLETNILELNVDVNAINASLHNLVTTGRKMLLQQ